MTAEQLFSPASVSTLTKVLLTHVVPGVAAKAASLTNGQVLTTANANQTLTVSAALLGIGGRQAMRGLGRLEGRP